MHEPSRLPRDHDRTVAVDREGNSATPSCRDMDPVPRGDRGPDRIRQPSRPNLRPRDVLRRADRSRAAVRPAGRPGGVPPRGGGTGQLPVGGDRPIGALDPGHGCRRVRERGADGTRERRRGTVQDGQPAGAVPRSRQPDRHRRPNLPGASHRRCRDCRQTVRHRTPAVAVNLPLP